MEDIPSVYIYGDKTNAELTKQDAEVIIPSYVLIGETKCKVAQVGDATNPGSQKVGFYGTSIKSIVIPDTVIKIGNYTFYNAASLKNVVFNNKNSLEIQANAFQGCTGLESIDLKNVTSIGNYAFQGCSGLESVTIGEDCESIGVSAFNGCNALKTVTIDSQDVVDLLTFVNTAGNLIDRAGVTIDIRADLTPTTYLTGIDNETDIVTIGEVQYKQYVKNA